MGVFAERCVCMNRNVDLDIFTVIIFTVIIFTERDCRVFSFSLNKAFITES